MSYDPNDAAMDALYDQISKELYPEHKVQAIIEFTEERLKSFYLKSPYVMRPAVDSLQQGKKLLEQNHYAPAVVFFVTAIELLLKATLLKPVIFGLVNIESLAEIIMQYAMNQTGFDRYENLLAELFKELTNINIKEIRRDGSSKGLFEECHQLQKIRNGIIHRGEQCKKEDAELANTVSVAVFEQLVRPMLNSLGLNIEEKGSIVSVEKGI